MTLVRGRLTRTQADICHCLRRWRRLVANWWFFAPSRAAMVGCLAGWPTGRHHKWLAAFGAPNRRQLSRLEARARALAKLTRGASCPNARASLPPAGLPVDLCVCWPA